MNELGFTETYLKEHFSAREWEFFDNWMHGQTIAQVEGDNTYYYYDVQTFCVRFDVKYPALLPPEFD